MKHNMKSATLKNIVVICRSDKKKPYWKDEIQVDSEIFNDPLLEAATRAVEKRKNKPDFQITVVLECYEKKYVKDPMQHFGYNSYFVMINAGLYEKAEMLRLNFKKEFGTDLKEESLRGESEENGPDTTNTDKPESN